MVFSNHPARCTYVNCEARRVVHVNTEYIVYAYSDVKRVLHPNGVDL